MTLEKSVPWVENAKRVAAAYRRRHRRGDFAHKRVREDYADGTRNDVSLAKSDYYRVFARGGTLCAVSHRRGVGSDRHYLDIGETFSRHSDKLPAYVAALTVNYQNWHGSSDIDMLTPRQARVFANGVKGLFAHVMLHLAGVLMSPQDRLHIRLTDLSSPETG